MFGMMVEFILENGSRIRCTGMENSNGQMVEGIVVITWTIRNKGTEYSNGV